MKREVAAVIHLYYCGDFFMEDATVVGSYL